MVSSRGEEEKGGTWSEAVFREICVLIILKLPCPAQLQNDWCCVMQKQGVCVTLTMTHAARECTNLAVIRNISLVLIFGAGVGD